MVSVGMWTNVPHWHFYTSTRTHATYQTGFQSCTSLYKIPVNVLLFHFYCLREKTKLKQGKIYSVCFIRLQGVVLHEVKVAFNLYLWVMKLFVSLNRPYSHFRLYHIISDHVKEFNGSICIFPHCNVVLTRPTGHTACVALQRFVSDFWRNCRFQAFEVRQPERNWKHCPYRNVQKVALWRKDILEWFDKQGEECTAVLWAKCTRKHANRQTLIKETWGCCCLISPSVCQHFWWCSCTKHILCSICEVPTYSHDF